MNLLVSIIIPNYNKEKYIKEAIESALNQSYRPIEVIVIDDGSTDNSKEIIKSYGNKVSAYFLPHNNANVARNFGFKRSMGRYIQYLDSDDVLYPEKIEKQIESLNSKNADISFCKWDSPLKRKTVLPEKLIGKDYLYWLLKDNWVPPIVPLYRRFFLKKVGLWDEGLERGQDTDYNFRISFLEPKITTLNEKLANYRLHVEKLNDTEFIVDSAINRMKVLKKVYTKIIGDQKAGKLLAALVYKTARIVYDHDIHLYRRYARYAFKISKNFEPLESDIYKKMYNLFGLGIAEKLGSLKRKLLK